MNVPDLELAGAVLYKCEGTKLRKDTRYPNGNTFLYAIEFTNSEPVLVKLFLEFLRKVIKVDDKRLKSELFLYPDMNKEKLKQFWSEITNIHPENFHKTIILKAKTSKFKPNPLGTCKIRYVGKEAFLRLNAVIIKKLGFEASLVK